MIDVYRKLFDLLDTRERQRFVLLLLMIVVMGMLELAGVASILPFLSLVVDPSYINEWQPLLWLYRLMGAPSEREFLIVIGACVVGLVVTSLAFKALTQFALIRFSTMRNFTLSRKIFSGYMAQPYAWFLNRHSADLGKSMLSEVDHVIASSMIPALNLLAYVTVVVALSIMLILVEPFAMLCAVAVLVGSYYVIYLTVRGLLTRIGRKRLQANARRYRLAGEALSGIKDVKLSGLEGRYIRQFSAPAKTYAGAIASGYVIGQVPRYVLEALAFGGMLTFVLYRLGRDSSGVEDVVPLLGLLSFAGVRLFPALQQVYRDFTQLRFGRHALDSLHALYKEVSSLELGLDEAAREPLRLERRLSLNNVTFAFPGAQAPTLVDLSMEIAAHTSVGIVGSSGAGKTTLVDVILGLLVPDGGKVCVDDLEITDANRARWRRSVGYVPQQIFLTDDTVAANIAFGIESSNIDLEAVQRAARMAELHEVVSELPDGYQTRVGERGVRLSGGQRQRIGIARALYHDPDVLVFDEATNALDNITERAIMDALRNIVGTKTVIIVAHRLTTLMSCDEIFLLENGAVSARGAYRELLETSDTFRAMAER